jgi:hypothetical protein
MHREFRYRTSLNEPAISEHESQLYKLKSVKNNVPLHFSLLICIEMIHFFEVNHGG